MITAGIDCGAGNTKTVLLKAGMIIGRGLAPTGFDLLQAAETSLAIALREAGIGRNDIRRIGATGSGKSAVAMADEQIDEIPSIAEGARYFFPDAHTAADVGAEEGRAVKIDADGSPEDSVVNEKCAAGAGTFIETMARLLDVSVEEMGRLSLQSDKKIAINTQCVVFAEAEVVGRMHAETDRADISRAIHDSIAGRIASLIRRIGVNPEVAVLGGLGRNPGFVAALRRELNVRKLHVPDTPEYGCAVGAAILAAKA